MKQNLLLVLLAAFLGCSSLWGQKLNAQRQGQVIQKIASTTASIKTMQCAFSQTKKMKMLKNEIQSSGVMYFKSPDKLRWQYKAPYSYVFVMNGNRVSLKSSNGIQNVDVQRNKMFKQISSIILGCVTGGSLRSSADFNVQICQEDGTYIAKLLPRKKELKSLYNYIKIKFNSSLNMVQSVEMSEKTGDTTYVSLINTKINSPISESVFTVN